MAALGWEQCDIIIVTGDAYVDHPSFGMAIIGRVLEAQGFKVGIIAQPNWHGTKDFEALGERSILIDCDVIVADGGATLVGPSRESQ